MNEQKTKLAELAAQIVAAYVSRSPVEAADLPKLINDVYRALKNVADAGGEGATAEDAPKPAISAKKSVTADYIICLEDGKQFKSLKRHLKAHYNMTPDQYRAKWNLPADYPMVAPNYAATRSSLARRMGLGRRGNTG